MRGLYGAIQTQFAGELSDEILTKCGKPQRSANFLLLYTQKGSDVSRNILIYTSYIGLLLQQSTIPAIDPRDQHPHVCFINGFRKLAAAPAAQGPRFPQYAQDSFNMLGAFACCVTKLLLRFFPLYKKDYML